MRSRPAQLTQIAALLLLLAAMSMPACQRSREPPPTTVEPTEAEQPIDAEPQEVEPEGSGDEADGTPQDPVDRAVAISAALLAQPDDTSAALAVTGTSLEELEALMFQIAADPELSARYRAESGTEP